MMKAIFRFLSALMAVAFLLASAVAADAADAQATTWLNVREGPGTSYDVVDTMAPGETGEITQCQGSWCYIERAGPDGWVSSSYITAAEDPPSDPDCRFELTLGPSGPQFSIVCGDGGGVGVNVPLPGGDQVCFYKNANYTGQQFCRGVGTYNQMPAGFNNAVTSIQLQGNAKARICEYANMGPFCRLVTSNEGQLGVYLDNEISSFRVYTGSEPAMKQACLFDGPTYTGDHLCLAEGKTTLPPAAQNRATSVLLLEGASVRLCTNPVYCIGPANNVTTNTPQLPAFWDNKTSSVWVY